jgi:hypothetical protein
LFPRTERRAALSAFVEGFSLHAATRVMASDRRGLWRLCAYGARGALAASRLSELPDGRFAYAMKRPLPERGTKAWTQGGGVGAPPTGRWVAGPEGSPARSARLGR